MKANEFLVIQRAQGEPFRIAELIGTLGNLVGYLRCHVCGRQTKSNNENCDHCKRSIFDRTMLERAQSVSTDPFKYAEEIKNTRARS